MNSNPGAYRSFRCETKMRLIFAMVVLLGVILQGGETLWNSPHPLEAEENAPASLIPFPREVIWGKGDLEIQTPLRWGIVVNAGHLGERDSRMLNTAWRGLCTEAGNEC